MVGGLPEKRCYLEKNLAQLERGLKRRRRSLPSFCKRGVHLLMDPVKIPCPDQKNLQIGRQNPIQLLKNDTYTAVKGTKLLD